MTKKFRMAGDEQIIKQWINESVQNPHSVTPASQPNRWIYEYYPVPGKPPMWTIIDNSDSFFKGRFVTSYPKT